MKLLVILSLIAYGYTDKLDRTYLPPPNAGTAGGSPGSLIAPGVQGSFGQGLPSSSASLSGSSNFGSSGFSQGNAQGPVKSEPGFGTGSGLIQPSGPSNYGSANVGQSASSPGKQTGFGGLGGNQAFAQASFESAQNKPSFGQQSGFLPSDSGSSQINSFGSSASSFGPVSGSQGSNGFGSSQPGFNSAQANVYAAPQPERPQAAADRNAEILKYVNENDGESYNYSYETSNGISAEEAGIATNGVRAQGGYAYTGDDGARYSITYTADENGYQPQGEHLPTPHPIPEEILKSIEENARAAAAGTQEGAYRPEEYESENSAQQYDAGVQSYNQPQRQNVNSLQGQGLNQQGYRFPNTQDVTGKGQLSGQTGSYSQAQLNQASNQNGQPQQGFGNFNRGSSQVSSQQSFGQSGQGVQNNGYEYSQPQNGFSSSASQRQSQNRLQGNAQKPAQAPGSGNEGIFGTSSNRPSFESSFQGNQVQSGLDKSSAYSKPGSQSNGYQQQNQQPTFGSKQPSIGSSKQSQQIPFGPSQPSFGPAGNGVSKEGEQSSFGLSEVSRSGQQSSVAPTQPSFGPTGISKQREQSSFKSSQQSFGAAGNSNLGQQTPFGSIQIFGATQQSSGSSDQGYQYGLNANQPAFNTGNGVRQGSQAGNKPFNANVGTGQVSTSVSGNQDRPSGAARPQYQENGNQPALGAGLPGQGSQFGPSGQFGPGAQSVSRGSQPSRQSQYQPGQQTTFGPSAPQSNGRLGANGSEFSGPRQPPSFSPQEGYKY